MQNCDAFIRAAFFPSVLLNNLPTHISLHIKSFSFFIIKVRVLRCCDLI